MPASPFGNAGIVSPAWASKASEPKGKLFVRAVTSGIQPNPGLWRAPRPLRPRLPPCLLIGPGLHVDRKKLLLWLLGHPPVNHHAPHRGGLGSHDATPFPQVAAAQSWRALTIRRAYISALSRHIFTPLRHGLRWWYWASSRYLASSRRYAESQSRLRKAGCRFIRLHTSGPALPRRTVPRPQ